MDGKLIAPKVTVLMPVYNGMQYLREAVDSVLCQTFSDFEFLIINDASTDGSLAFLRSFSDPRIRIVCNELNIGQAASLSVGLRLARGQYIARLDQDDVCMPTRLAQQVAFQDQRPGVAVTCTWEYSIDSTGRRTRLWRKHVASYGVFLGELLVGKTPVWHPSAMIRTAAAVEVGGYDAAFALAEDYDLWSKLALARHNAAIVPDVLVLQRVHEGRQSLERAGAQRDSLVRSHQRLVSQFCPKHQSEFVSLLLRMDDALWQRRWRKSDLASLIEALAETIDNIREQQHLSDEEHAQLSRIVYRRLGPGVRLGKRAVRLPAWAYWLVFFALSPRMNPRIRRVTSSANNVFHELRFPSRVVSALWNKHTGK